ncbi:MAG: histidinol-phosphatase [Cyclobacteriaceae bacterium]
MFKIQYLFILSAILFVACTPEKPLETKQWYKGNLHTHSFWSDGNDFPEMIMDWYKTHDYDFIVLSDHNTLAEGEKWKSFSEKQKFIYEKYLAKYGEDWIESRLDSAGTLEVKLKTFAEYRPLFEEEGEFLIIQSEEITDRFEDKHIHINVTNIQELIKPQGGNSVSDVMQNNIDKVLEQREELDVPMFPHINHPNFIWSITPDDMIQLSGERFFEVYNGHPAVHNYGDSLRPGMEALWDLVQTAYLRDGKPSIYGLAVDDAHSYHNFGPKDSNPGRGWVMVYTDVLSPEKIVEAMEAGDFYATTGVTLKEISFDGKTLSLEVTPEENITYKTQFFGSRETSEGIETGVFFEEASGTSAKYTLKDGDMYVRAKVISSKPKENPYQEGDMEVAWTQPVLSE